MEWAKVSRGIAVEAFLEGERHSEVRHEYIGGKVHAMDGASEEHNLISGNFFAALQAHLRGKPCRGFIPDMKLRLQVAGDDLFYYPDVMVVCDPRDTDRYFKRHPRVLVEVLSPETERTDRRERFLGYQWIDSLEEYLLVAQDKVEVTVFRRANQWVPEILRGREDNLRMPSLEFAMSVADLYDGLISGSDGSLGVAVVGRML
jgi:Uma2 family endonuclease